LHQQLIVSSDCGFGRQGGNHGIAFFKSSSTAQGANIVRRELGLPTTRVPAADPLRVNIRFFLQGERQSVGGQ
jgi:5-methyltetrahydropteroyltriglutamate--homocysteine methyltransferase